MIIDIHTHVWGFQPEKNREDLLAAMERYGLDRIYVSGLQSKQSDEEEVARLNSLVYDFMRQEPEKVGGAVYVNPLHRNTLDIIKRAIEEQGFEMIKLWVCTYADHPAVDPIMEYAEATGVPVLFHSFHKAVGQLENETTGIHVANIARRHPKTKILMAHLGGNCYDGIPAIRECKNVWCDTSGSTFFHGDDLNYTVEQIGAERILFGTDATGSCGSNIGQVLGADLTEAQRELIFYKNAQKLLDRNFRL